MLLPHPLPRPLHQHLPHHLAVPPLQGPRQLARQQLLTPDNLRLRFSQGRRAIRPNHFNLILQQLTRQSSHEYDDKVDGDCFGVWNECVF